jgi:RNA polymerase sigma-70 factor (ECF subfamily)
MSDCDEAQWIEWYRSLEKPLYNLAYRWLWDAVESQDVVQEAFLRCWRIRERIVAERFRALIFRTTLRLLSNRVRRKKLWRFVPFAGSGLGSTKEAADTLAAAEVRLALDAIAEPRKQVLLLSEIGGLSYKEIAEVMEISEGTVGSRRNRALAELRERLSARGVEWDES